MNLTNLTAPAEKIDWSEDVPQNDGASEIRNGSNLQEPEYNVEVKLSDLQDDPNNPLFSVKNFADLGLYVNTFLQENRTGLTTFSEMRKSSTVCPR